MFARSRLTVFLALTACLLLAAIASLAVGSRMVAPGSVWQALWTGADTRDAVVVRLLRLPRTMLGLAAGCALGLAGALMQGLTRNPLAEPGLMGVNAGAALAVVMSIGLLGVADTPVLVGAALVGSALAATAVLTFARGNATRQGRIHLVLTGVAVSACLRATTGIFTLSNTATFDSYRFWVVGSLNARLEGAAGWAGPAVLAVAVPSLLLGRGLNALALGEELAGALGNRSVATRGLCLAALVVLCGLATAMAGPIAFAGLAVPAIVRWLVGEDWRWILPCSGLGGALLLLLADTIGRVVIRPGELEAGIVVAIVGAPMLVWLAARTRAPG